MDVSSVGVCKALFVSSLVMTSCAPARIAPSGTSTEAVSKTAFPTVPPYWELDPALPDPIGGWRWYRIEELDLAFEYPSVYDNGKCGAIFMEQVVVEDREYDLIGLGSSIRISVYGKWGSELEEFTETLRPPSHLTLLTDVEAFTLGGRPAHRYIHRIVQDPEAFEYAKAAWLFHKSRLYWFSYGDIADLPRCGAPPLSEDDVYEHMLSTIAFLE